MGGFLAQQVAIDHPGRVRSLTSVSSTPASRVGGIPQRSVFLRMNRLAGTPETSERQAEDQAVTMFRLIGSPAYPMDEAAVRAAARISYARAARRRARATCGSGRRARPPRTAARRRRGCGSRRWCCTATATR